MSLSGAPVRKFKADTDDRYFNTNTKIYKIALIQK